MAEIKNQNLYLNYKTSVLSDDVVLSSSDSQVQFLNPGAINRIVKLPTINTVIGCAYSIINQSNTNSIIIQDHLDNDLSIIEPLKRQDFITDGENWYLITSSSNIEGVSGYSGISGYSGASGHSPSVNYQYSIALPVGGSLVVTHDNDAFPYKRSCTALYKSTEITPTNFFQMEDIPGNIYDTITQTYSNTSTLFTYQVNGKYNYGIQSYVYYNPNCGITFSKSCVSLTAISIDFWIHVTAYSIQTGGGIFGLGQSYNTSTPFISLKIVSGGNLLYNFGGGWNVYGGTLSYTDEVFYDSSTYNFDIVNLNVKSVSEQNAFGTNVSIYFDGAAHLCASNIYNSYFAFSEDFTIDFWFYMTVNSTIKMLCNFAQSTNSQYGFYIYISLTNYLCVGIANVTVITSTETILTGRWYHVALVRSGSIMTLYINGILTGSSYNTSANFTDGRCYIGRDSYTAQYYYNGYIDEFRVSRGIARWVSNFSVPTSIYEPDVYTTLLIHSKNSISENTNYGWYHITCTWDGTIFKSYLNGEFVTSYESTGSNQSTSTLLCIGTCGNGLYACPQITYDNFMIFDNVELPQDAIKDTEYFTYGGKWHPVQIGENSGQIDINYSSDTTTVFTNNRLVTTELLVTVKI